MTLNLPIEVVDKKLASVILGIPASDFDTYLSEDAAKEFAAGRSKVPPMPHIPGRPVQFYLSQLREWHQRFFVKGWTPEHFQRGGAIPTPNRKHP